MPATDSYAARSYWRQYLAFLPDVMRLPRAPDEEWWQWHGTDVNLYRLDVEDAVL